MENHPLRIGSFPVKAAAVSTRFHYIRGVLSARGDGLRWGVRRRCDVRSLTAGSGGEPIGLALDGAARESRERVDVRHAAA